MKRLLIPILALAALGAAAASANAPRIAVVDVQRVFKEYYKSRIAEDFIKQQGEAARLYLGQLNRELESLRAESARLGTNARNMALSPEGRSQAEAAALEAARKVREKETEIRLYVQDREREIKELETRKRAEIVGDIRAEIRRRASAEGYDWVLDSSGLTTNMLPTVLLFPEHSDISNAVIRELNRGAVKTKK